MSTYTIRTTADKPRFVMPACAAFGVSTWGQTDAAARAHVAALVKGANPGTSVWSSPPS